MKIQSNLYGNIKPNAKEVVNLSKYKCDVARYGENDTSIFIFKVKPRENGWRKEVVFTQNLTKMNLLAQAAYIKELVKEYRPKEVVIDGNGVKAHSALVA